MSGKQLSSNLLSNLKPTILKELIKYIPIKRFLSIISTSKQYQTLFNLNYSSYHILYYLSLRKSAILLPKSFSEIFEGLLHKHSSMTLDEIASGLCLYLISLQNKLKLKHIPVYLEYPELFIIYQKIANDFKYSFNISISLTEDYQIEYPKQAEEFINQYFSYFEAITILKAQFKPYDNPKIQLENLLNKIKETIHYVSFSNYKFTSNEIQMLDIVNKCFNCNITQCNLSHNSFCIPLLDKILKLDLNKQLISLKLCSSKLYNQSIEKLSQSHCFHQLRTLILANNRIEDIGIMKLSNAFFPSLEKLDLTYNKINKEGVYYLSKGLLTTLKTLILEGNNLFGAAKDLFINTNLINLTKLNVIDCNMKDIDFDSMNHTNIKCLNKLLINKNKNLGKNCLLFVFNIKSLEYIDVSNTSLNLNDLLFQDEYNNESLHCIIFSHNKLILSDVLIEVFKKDMFPNIHSIDLFNNNVDNRFIDYITENKPNKLEYINIDLNPLISKKKITHCYSIFKRLNKYK